MRSFKAFAFIIILLISLTIIVVPSIVGAQNESPSSTNANITSPYKMGVKIISPLKNSTVPIGQLIISGISSDTAITNCMVSADWNDLKPMQNVTAKGLVEQMTIQIGHLLTTKPTIILPPVSTS